MKKTLKILFFSSFLLSSFCYAMEDETSESSLPGFTHIPDDHYSEQHQQTIRSTLAEPSNLDVSMYGDVLIIGGAPTQSTFSVCLRNHFGYDTAQTQVPKEDITRTEIVFSKRIGLVQNTNVSFIDRDPFYRYFDHGYSSYRNSPKETPFLKQLAGEFIANGRLFKIDFSSPDFANFAQTRKFGLIALDYMTFHHAAPDIFSHVASMLSEGGILFMPTFLSSEPIRENLRSRFQTWGCDADLLQLDFPIGDESPLKPHEAFLAALSAEHLRVAQSFGQKRAIYYVQKRSAASAAE